MLSSTVGWPYFTTRWPIQKNSALLGYNWHKRQGNFTLKVSNASCVFYRMVLLQKAATPSQRALLSRIYFAHCGIEFCFSFSAKLNSGISKWGDGCLLFSSDALDSSDILEYSSNKCLIPQSCLRQREKI